MTCCLALAFAVAFLRAAHRFVTGRSDEGPGFAPVAYRPGPTVIGIVVTSAHDEPAPRVVPEDRLGPVVRGVALGTCAYGLAVFALVELGVAVVFADASIWLARCVAVAGLGAAVLVVSERRADPGVRAQAASAHVFAWLGAAFAWFELGVIDVEVLGLFRLGACACCDWKSVAFVVGAPAAVVAALVVARSVQRASLRPIA